MSKSLEERVEYLEALLGASALAQMGEEDDDRDIGPQPDPEGFFVLDVDTWGSRYKSIRLVQRKLTPDQYDRLVSLTCKYEPRREPPMRRPPTWMLRGIDRSTFPVSMVVLMDERFEAYELD